MPSKIPKPASNRKPRSTAKATHAAKPSPSKKAKADKVKNELDKFLKGKFEERKAAATN